MHNEVWAAQRLLFSRSEASKLLGVSERFIDYAIANGRLSSIRKGRRRLISRDSLLNFASTDQRERISL